jgi:hypothetical protein
VGAAINLFLVGPQSVLLVRPAPEPRAEPVPVAQTEAAEAEKVS